MEPRVQCYWMDTQHIHNEDILIPATGHIPWGPMSWNENQPYMVHMVKFECFMNVFLSKYGLLELWCRNMRFAGYHSRVIKRIDFRCIAIPTVKLSSGNLLCLLGLHKINQRKMPFKSKTIAKKRTFYFSFGRDNAPFSLNLCAVNLLIVRFQPLFYTSYIYCINSSKLGRKNWRFKDTATI